MHGGTHKDAQLQFLQLELVCVETNRKGKRVWSVVLSFVVVFRPENSVLIACQYFEAFDQYRPD